MHARLRTAILTALLCGIAATPMRGDSVETVSKGAPEIWAVQYGAGKSLPAGYDATRVKYFLHKPAKYDPKKAWPLILAISPTPVGGMMFLPFATAAAKHDFFFACPNEAGNESNTETRGQKALDTLFDVRAKFNIDPEQIYVTGFSGGSRMASGMVLAFPGLFAGEMALGGFVIGEGDDTVPKMKTKLGYYIFCGEKCMNRPESERVHAYLVEAKVPCELMVAPGLGHDLPTAEMGLQIYEWFLARQASAGGSTLAAKTAAAEREEKAGNLGAALAGYEAVAAAGGDGEAVRRARERAAALAADGKRQVEAAKKQPAPDALAALDKLIAAWRGSAVAKAATEARAAIADSPATRREAEERRKATRERDAQAAVDRAAELEKAGRLAEAQEAYAAAAREFADTSAGQAAQAAADRLAADPRLALAKQESDARRMMQKAENLIQNRMLDQAKAMLEEIAGKFPETETGKKAKKMADEIR